MNAWKREQVRRKRGIRLIWPGLLQVYKKQLKDMDFSLLPKDAQKVRARLLLKLYHSRIWYQAMKWMKEAMEAKNRGRIDSDK